MYAGLCHESGGNQLDAGGIAYSILMLYKHLTLMHNIS